MHNPEHRHRKLSQVRAEETREAILQKAREAFAEHGFAGASIRDIAVEAGTTHSMIRYHFGTKDQLWREAVRDIPPSPRTRPPDFRLVKPTFA